MFCSWLDSFVGMVDRDGDSWGCYTFMVRGVGRKFEFISWGIPIYFESFL